MQAHIVAVEHHLPEGVLSNDHLALEFPEWPVDKIEQKTGIVERHIAADGECASDLAERAVRKLFDGGVCQPAEIDYLVLCTQSPDYLLPTTACLLQHRLGVPVTAGALDINLGCSGYVYGLGLAKGLIETGQAANVLLVTAETYSKYINEGDKSARTIFGDGASATLVSSSDRQSDASIGPFVYGTDGSGGQHLIVPTGGMRRRWPVGGEPHMDEAGNVRTEDDFYMNGPEIFAFTLRVVPKAVNELLTKANKTIDGVNLFVFHQANGFMLEHLRRRIGIPKERFATALREFGNTVSSTIPIALCSALSEGRLRSGDLVMLVGFGVGLSWGATLVRWA